MITCEPESVLEKEDLYARLVPYRIFRISDHKCEPVPVYSNSDWITSMQTFPSRFIKVKSVYDSDTVKVKIYHDNQKKEVVRPRSYFVLFII